MNAKADLVTGAVFQVLLASIASVTFAPVANIIIEAADLGANVSLPVGDLIKTVAFLQVGRRSHQANLHRCMLQAATRPAPSLPVSDVAWLSRRAECRPEHQHLEQRQDGYEPSESSSASTTAAASVSVTPASVRSTE